MKKKAFALILMDVAALSIIYYAYDVTNYTELLGNLILLTIWMANLMKHIELFYAVGEKND